MPAVESPVAAPAGDERTVGGESHGADPIALSFERRSNSAGRTILKPDHLVAAAARQRAAVG